MNAIDLYVTETGMRAVTRELYQNWLEEKVEKYPSLEDVMEYINTNGDGLVLDKDITRVYAVIKKLWVVK
jgi:hypothetical protein